MAKDIFVGIFSYPSQQALETEATDDGRLEGNATTFLELDLICEQAMTDGRTIFGFFNSDGIYLTLEEAQALLLGVSL